MSVTRPGGAGPTAGPPRWHLYVSWVEGIRPNSAGSGGARLGLWVSEAPRAIREPYRTTVTIKRLDLDAHIPIPALPFTDQRTSDQSPYPLSKWLSTCYLPGWSGECWLGRALTGWQAAGQSGHLHPAPTRLSRLG